MQEALQIVLGLAIFETGKVAASWCFFVAMDSLAARRPEIFRKIMSSRLVRITFNMG